MAKKNPDKPKIIDEKIEPEVPVEPEIPEIQDKKDEGAPPLAPVPEAPLEPEPTPEQDLRSLKTIYVTIAPYSSRYKQLTIEQHKNDPSLASGAVVLLGKTFSPGRNYSIEETPEVLKLIKDGMLISMTGSFRFRVRDEPKANVEGENA
jgi:hypothetical protein